MIVSFDHGWQGRDFVGDFDLLLLRPNGVHAIGEFLRLVEIGQLALHPDQIGIRRVRNRASDSGLTTPTNAVETLPRPRRVPVKVHIHTRQALGNRASFAVALALGELLEFGDQAGFVDVHTGVDGVSHSFVEEFKVCLRVPGVFDGLEVGAGFAGGFGVEH
jgi:hypothetical protein